jgi:hypothetical protein
VFLCQDLYLDRPVVIKFVHAPANFGFVLNEIRALSTVRSKHVIELYEISRTETVRAPGFSLGVFTGSRSGVPFD